MPRRFSNKRKGKTKRTKRARRKSKRKLSSYKRKSILKPKNHKKNTESITFAKGTKFNNEGHKEPRMMTKEQIKNYLSKCIANPWRFFDDGDCSAK